ncbi:hypothetical protein A0H81_00797 [Grifola frondosa]|uniref:Uncharacterized protein n=1 Tax=Grifola frondosa TaxID=5627 RepID=A0A1C7MRL5_GRIFR|nr:hypothetical protein A0H81_00797 [Grifola frondosa]
MFRHEEHEQASPRHSTVKISRTKRSSSLDLQSRASSQTTLSPDAQDPLLPHMQSQHVNGRKLSRGKGFLSRKSVKKHSDTPPKSPSSSSERFSSFAAQKNFVDNELLARPRPLFMPHAVSIIPDPLGELPPWYHKEVEYAATSAVQFRTKYPMHDPIGPRWYRNHHLLAPVQEGRPPSMFSSAFPAMVPAPEHTQDPAHMSGPSRTPSGSPLPTPSSSQVRIQEPATKPRSRKTSQTAHDTVDMLDVTDPWGTNWHHESPYDIGANGERNAEPESPISSRPRRRSLTNVSRHRTVNPSPLSQSTSAVHLHTLDSPDAQIPRRLSKRRKPFAGLFGGQNHEGGQTHHKPVLVPTSGTPTYSQTENLHRKPSRAHSTLHSSSLTLQTVHHGAPKEKHSSMLGRLVKRFSVLRRPDTTKVAQNGIGHNWHSDVGPNASNRPSFTGPQAPESAPRASSNSAKGLDPVRRIPPPSVETTSRTSFQEHSRYSASIEEPATAGILTIANPDEPSVQTAVADIEAAAAHEETQVLDMPTSESPVSMHSPVPSPPSEHVDQRTETPIRSVSPPLPNIPESPEASTREVPLPSISEVSSPHTASTERPLPPSPSRTNVPDTTSETAASEIAANAPSIPSVDDSALSRLSIIANPPTPYAPPINIPPPMAVAATNNPVDGTKSQRVKASSSTRNRQTETFKLMRSPSGNEHPDGSAS